MATSFYQAKLPLEINEQDSFVKINNESANIKQKLRMIVLTNKGEKIMNPDFGVGIQKYLFENNNKKINYNYNSLGALETIDSINIAEEIKMEINSQVNKYLQEINISNIEILIENNTLYTKIEYEIRGFFQDSLTINL